MTLGSCDDICEYVCWMLQWKDNVAELLFDFLLLLLNTLLITSTLTVAFQEATSTGPSHSVTQMMSLGNSLVAEIPFLVSVVELIPFCLKSRFYCDTNNAQFL